MPGERARPGCRFPRPRGKPARTENSQARLNVERAGVGRESAPSYARVHDKILIWRSAAVCDSTSRSNVRTFSRAELFHVPVTSRVAAAGLRYSRAPPDEFRQPLKFSTVQKNFVLHQQSPGRACSPTLVSGFKKGTQFGDIQFL